MKKTLYIISIIALMVGLCQCRKPVFPHYGDGELETITFVADCGNNSKGEFTHDLDLKYEWDKDNDKMYVYASDDGSFEAGHGKYCGCLSIQSLSSDKYTATFSGDVVMPYNTGKVHFIHYGSGVTVNSSTGVASVSFAEQDGTLATISSKVVTACKMNYNSSGSYTPTAENKLLVQFAIINLSFSNFTGTDVISRGFENNGIEVTAEGMINYTKGSSSVLRNAATTSGSYYTVFMPEASAVIHSFLGDAEEARMQSKQFTLGTFYYGSSFSAPCEIPGTKIMPDGVIGGKFTVDNSGTKVYFAKGNVQQHKENVTWKFADHQYDFIGSDNTSTSQEYKDLLDWGMNFGDEWFTPSKDQYDYIIGKNTGSKRTTCFIKKDNTVATDFYYSAVKVTVNSNKINGVLLFPDHFQWTTAMGSEPTKNSSSSSKTYNTTEFGYIENAGAVFIPCAGFRNGSSISRVNEIGDYWTSTENGSSAYTFQVFPGESTVKTTSFSKSYGFAVRLIREVTTPSGNNVGGEAEGLDLKPWDNP